MDVIISIDTLYNDDIMLCKHFPKGTGFSPFSSGLFIAATYYQCLMSSVVPTVFFIYLIHLFSVYSKSSINTLHIRFQC